MRKHQNLLGPIDPRFKLAEKLQGLPRNFNHVSWQDSFFRALDSRSKHFGWQDNIERTVDKWNFASASRLYVGMKNRTRFCPLFAEDQDIFTALKTPHYIKRLAKNALTRKYSMKLIRNRRIATGVNRHKF